MWAIAAVGLLGGIVLGKHFKVRSTIAPMLVAAAAVLYLGIPAGWPFREIVLALGAVTLAVQVGYLSGAFWQFAAPAPRLPNNPPRGVIGKVKPVRAGRLIGDGLPATQFEVNLENRGSKQVT